MQRYIQGECKKEDLDLGLVFAEGEEVVLLRALDAALLVRGALVVALHLAVILVRLAADAVPACMPCQL